MSFDNIVGRLKTFDAYPKTLEDFRTKTYGGAVSKWNYTTLALLWLFWNLYQRETKATFSY